MLKLTQLALIMIIGYLDAKSDLRLRVETRKTVFLVRLLDILIVRDGFWWQTVSIFINNKESWYCTLYIWCKFVAFVAEVIHVCILLKRLLMTDN